MNFKNTLSPFIEVAVGFVVIKLFSPYTQLQYNTIHSANQNSEKLKRKQV